MGGIRAHQPRWSEDRRGERATGAGVTDRQLSPAPPAAAAPRWWRRAARTTLVAAPAGLLSALGATWADQHDVTEVLASCVNSPGMPLPGQLATWAAPVLGVASTVGAALLLRSAHRAGRRTAGLLEPLLVLLLFLAPLLVLFELVCCWKVQPDLAPRAHHCEGLAAVLGRR